jgi:hypothetical protein
MYTIMYMAKPHTENIRGLKIGNGHVFFRSVVLDCHGSVNYY